MSRISRVSLALLISCASISPAAATVFVFHGTFSGLNENPPNASPGFGSVSVTWDDVAHTMSIEAFFGGLTGTTTAAHIHAPAPPGSNAGVATQLPSFSGFPLGVTSGTYSTLFPFDMTSTTSYNPSFIANFGGGTVAGAEAALLAALLGGNAYFNIHTSQFPGGEVRANLALVPEPASWMMMIGGFAFAGLAFRRRRSRELAPA